VTLPRWTNTPPRPAIQVTLSPGRRAYAALVYDLLVLALALVGGLAALGLGVWTVADLLRRGG
jgi:hypothetical protein